MSCDYDEDYQMERGFWKLRTDDVDGDDVDAGGLNEGVGQKDEGAMKGEGYHCERKS